MAAYDDLVSIEEQTAYVLGHPGWTGVPQARAALALADENSWSPRETHTRLIWTQVAGLDPPMCNRPVFDDADGFIGTPDLLDDDAGLAVEYDGSQHLQGEQRAHDIGREHALRSHGLDYLTVVAGHLADPEALARRMRQTHQRAQRSAAARAWTVREPAWWEPSYTVAQRRALTGRARAAVDRLRRRAS